MNSSGHKLRELLLVVLAGVCLTTSGLCAEKTLTSSSAHKLASRPAAKSPVHHPATPSTAKKAGSPTTASHSATHYRVTHHPGSAQYAARKTTAHESSAAVVKKTPNRTAASASQHKGSAVHNRRQRSTPATLSGQQRLARTHLQPERVEEIQQALIREGYLQGDPNGEWDSRTRAAMLRYQTMNGFPPTGLPEAKSLMKLGLGSHPLPPELDHGEVGVASSGITQSVQSVFSVSPNSLPASPSSPPNLNTPPPETK